MKTNQSVPNVRQIQRRNKIVLLAPIAVAGTLLLLALAFYFGAAGQQLMTALWSKLGPTAQDLVTLAAVIGAVVVAATISLHIGKRIYLLRNGTQLASVAIIAAGGYAAFLRRFTQGLPRRVRHLVFQGYVLVNDGIRGNKAIIERPKSYEFNTRLVNVQRSQANTDSRAYHESLSTQYIPHIKPAIKAAGRIYLVLSRGGGTGPGVITALTKQAWSTPTTVVLVGKSPQALIEAVNDPQYACKGRAFAARIEKASAQHGWTNGQPDLVEVPA